MPCLTICARDGNRNVKHGCAFIRSRGAPNSSANIMNGSQAQSNVGSTRAYGSCVLRRQDCARIVGEALCHFDGERLALISSVVMPNHVHALFVQSADWLLETLLRSWKSFTSRKINSLLGRSG